MKNNNISDYLNCTKEVIFSLKEAKKLTLLNNNNSIQPIHLCLSLIFNSKLVQKVLNISFSTSLQKHILKSFLKDNDKKKNKLNLTTNITIHKNILYIFNILSNLEIPFNTLILFIYLWKQNISLFNFIFDILNIKYINTIYVQKYINIFFSKIEIPVKLKNILSLLKGNNNIKNRESEIEKINEILTRKINRNVILIGEEGVGKFSIIQKIVYNNKNKIFINLNLINLHTFLNNNNNLINFLFKFLISIPNIIIYCKDIHLIFDSENSNFKFLKYMLIEYLTSNKLQLIGTSSSIMYQQIIEKNTNISYIFTKMLINEPEKHILLLIFKEYLKLNKSKKIIIFDNILEFLIDLSAKYITKYVFPKKGFLVLDSIFSKYQKKSQIKDKIITRKDIINIISQYSNVSNTLMLKENNLSTFNINTIESNLKKCVFGQDTAILKIVASLKRAYTGLKDKNKPIGSWLFCGPSGTGKTELVKSLAKLLFGTEKELIRFDMSEFMEKHSIAKLIGPPPGYIGYEEGGLLTEAVKKKPYSVILFDEIEKAHKDINNIMLQLLDEGVLTDSKGEHIDFTNTLIVYTSNLGCPKSSEEFKSFQNGIELSEKEYKFLSKNVDIAVKKFFKPELLNRLNSVIVFKPLSIFCLNNIIDKFIYNLSNKLNQNNILLEIEPEIKILLAKLAYHPLYGARPLKRIVEQFIEKPISELIVHYKFKTPYIFSIFKDIEKDIINYSIKKL